MSTEPVSPPNRAVLIVNTKSRRGKELFHDAQETLTTKGITLTASHTARSVGELHRITRAAVTDVSPMVIIGGGDGTISAIARHFVGKSSVLGVLPLGTGNAFARDIGIPTELDAACDVLVSGEVQGVDLGIADHDYFVNVATAGLTTLIAQNLTNGMKKRLGRFVYVVALARALQKIEPFYAEIETDNGIDEFETLQIVIGNGRFHAGPFPLSPHASITEGRLSLYALDGTNKASFLKLAAFMTVGQHIHLPDVHFQDCRGGVIRTRPSMPVTVDGEVCANTPLKFGILPDALRVVTPRGQVI